MQAKHHRYIPGVVELMQAFKFWGWPAGAIGMSVHLLALSRWTECSKISDDAQACVTFKPKQPPS
jgi:hypothetical protein